MSGGSQSDLDLSVAPGVFSISEIHRRILENLGKSDLAAAARVCRTWVDLALDILWEELESVLPIMALLGPISLHQDGWDWDHGFAPGNWTRFESFTKRIRSLSYYPTRHRNQKIVHEHMSPHVPTELLYYTTSNHGQYIVPQLCRIRWNCDDNSQLRMVVPFISPKLKYISFEVGLGVLPSGMARPLRALRAALPPGIAAFQFVHRYRGLGAVRGAVDALLEHQGDLHDLRLPFYPMGPILFKPQLRVLEADLYLESGINAEHLLSQLVDTCPLLEHLRIMLWEGCDMINLRVIRPLLRCSTLRSLDLEYSEMFDLNTKDVHEMGSAWRELEALHIASRRVYNSSVDPTFGTPLGSLAAFAESFSPKLRKLGLYLNTRDIPDPPHPSIRFPNLETFYVGTSLLIARKAHVAKAAAFLRALLPQGIQIGQSDYHGGNSYRSVFDSDSLEPPTSSWLALSQTLSQGEIAEILSEESDSDSDSNSGLDADETASLAG